ncbi:MAG: PfaD family polyunsaturated fatty acid/polyketide biosynthesis protein [Candidatus Anammoxibacter sp.]
MITSLKDKKKYIGWWLNEKNKISSNDREMFHALAYIHSNIYVAEKEGAFVFGRDGRSVLGEEAPFEKDALPLAGYVPAVRMENLGDNSFCKTHELQYPLVAGAMANGICSTDIVEAMGKSGMLAFFGAAGLSIEKIESAIDRLEQCSVNFPFGFNLIHSPGEPDHEAAVVDLYLRRKVRLVEASAFLGLTLPVVKYRVSDIYRDKQGNIVTPNRVVAKISRIEVASKFFAPPPDSFLQELVANGTITHDQAELAGHIPMAQDITAESDSGGHTDNRPAVTLLPTLLVFKDKMQAEHGYKQQLRVGAAGGVATPAAVSAMFSMGAAYVVTGTVNQSCVEAGTSDVVREMLAGTKQADVAMAPAADMFEMGVKVQVLKRGTMFAMRAAKLYEFYCKYENLDAIPANERSFLEKNIFCDSLNNIWDQTCAYFTNNDPSQIARAEKDSKHKMAPVFRWYLGQSSLWANSGEPSRKIDYQIWCGPSMGAFNEWVRGSFLEDLQKRKVVTVSLNLLYGAAVNARLNILRAQGFSFPTDVFCVAPLELSLIKELTEN